MRVGFMTPFAVDDPTAWSGVVSPMFSALDVEVELVHLKIPNLRHHPVDRAATRLLGSVGHGYLPDHALATSSSLGPGVSRVVRESRVDAVLAVAASTAMAYADVEVPVVEVGDATFHLMTDYYPMFTGLHPFARWQGEVLARRAARRSAAFLLTSDWAADSLTCQYGVAAARIRVSPFGPSLTAPEPPPGPRPGAPLRVLFVGSSWARKGGDFAVDVVEACNAAGIPCELTVVGESPGLPRDVRRLGHVPRERMGKLYASHDVLLEPALANAGGVTLTDATVSGLPVVATRTGGVESIVDDGVTGLLIDPTRIVPEGLAALRLLAQPGPWREMSSAGRRRGHEDLSWARWAAQAAGLCRQVVHSRS